MNGFFEGDNLYYMLLSISLCLIPVYYYYNNYLLDIITNKTLSTNQDLLDYSNLYLQDFFSLTSSSQLLNNFLNNKFLFNFFKNLIILYPSPEFFMLNFSNNEKMEILNFYKVIEKNSFESFSKHTITKKTFYMLLYTINKKIFCLDI